MVSAHADSADYVTRCEHGVLIVHRVKAACSIRSGHVVANQAVMAMGAQNVDIKCLSLGGTCRQPPAMVEGSHLAWSAIITNLSYHTTWLAGWLARG
jgi:hypothetical protein